MHVIKSDVLARPRWEAHDIACAPRVCKCQVAEGDVADVCAVLIRTTVAVSRLIPRLNVQCAPGLTSVIESIVFVQNITDVSTVACPSFDVDTHAPLAYGFVHVVASIDDVLNAAGDGRSDGHPHATPECIVYDCDVSAWPVGLRPFFTSIADSRQDGEVIVAAVNVVVLNQYILARIDVYPVTVKSGDRFIADMGEPGDLDLHVMNMYVLTINWMKRPERTVQ